MQSRCCTSLLCGQVTHNTQAHITWNEFIPRVLGWNAVNLYELNLLPEGQFIYDTNFLA